ncbi:hypothetical protein A3J90_00075 [candidate division WOR-1 bacterium RIFOXYC2_FULL_37_10]|uniref:DUF721 domain-containing protein n=1 Tax=candidate division WOR-1 bacterium RIFOXYB2_FULL_37_13 TaxID=1802579 RepID=A0A1F4SEG2_UNCSA|nr:MAG: hypothetical protein A2246_04090 [candidate division WOR-1 bacterium RIFOXYA2_FULL_37_7]OGC18804.1 MAG: hypothetical protein A2310_08220 [candidate division WOR-1 bacterium RIFOXYB2_FULL_37_13]OGC32507.1 MAG: hypothetical protein A3J90_00075 [candidate division WOR-1 bacterium RIFOXYC2_FULL_37_10]
MTELLKNIFCDSKLLKCLNGVLLWEKVVNKKIAKHTQAVKILNKVLYVVADSSVWAQELNFLKREIIDKINKEANEILVKDIRFKVGGLD